MTRKSCNSSYGFALVGLLVSLWLSGCQTSETADSSAGRKPQVVSTSTIITDWSERVGRDEIELTGILEPGDDPHVYEPVPADIQALEEADLILYNGYNLEPALIRLINSARGKVQKLAVGEIVAPLDLEYEGQTEPDPHVWGDVENAIAMVNAIRDELIALSPEDEARFRANAANLSTELERLDTWIEQQIATIPPDQRQLITTHDAFQYYAHAYGLKVVGTLIGMSTEEKPSARTVQQLVESVKASGVPTIFAETTINPALIQTVAQEANVQLAQQELYSDSLGAPGGEADSYLKMMVTNTRTIVEALGGNYSPYVPANSTPTKRAD